MRSCVKVDDGWLDLAVKIVTIGAFAFAVHQYMYRVYPVWSKEKELAEVSQRLERKQKALEVVSQDLSIARMTLRDKEEQVREAKLELEAVQQDRAKRERELKNEIQKLVHKAETLKREYEVDKLRISAELRNAKRKIETKNSRMIGVYLESFANDIFDMQIDNIRWSRGEEQLDLKRDIVNYSKDRLASEKDPIKRTALELFKLYAEKEINSGQKDYAKALMVAVFYQYNPEAQEWIERLNNVGELVGGHPEK